ncbi:MAG: MDR family MFS transporter [Herpetosiphon sp.]
MTQRRVAVITAGVMLSMFMASMESTVVSTAMPTIVSQLGGLSSYSWVFAAYLLASTTTVPIYGKLADMYGRRPIYMIALSLFLIGSLLCGRATSMGQLIGYRTVQGLGAGGLLPMAFIVIADLFNFEQRARMQGWFSGVWGVSSIVGPLLGGFLVDKVSWHWIFYINIVPGVVAGAVFWWAWFDQPRASDAQRPSIDFAGAAVLSGAVIALLMGLFELGSGRSWLLLALSAALCCALFFIERRASDPIVPVALLRDRTFAVACAQGLLAGWALFGTAAYVPLFVQAVLGTSATEAGATLTPQLLGWVTATMIGTRLLLRVGYRTLAVAGMIMLTIGTALLALLGVHSHQVGLMVMLAIMGIGMGLSVPAFLIAVQSTVRRSDMGTATAAIQFSRNIGSTFGVSVMGAVLALRIAHNLRAVGANATFSLTSLLDPVSQGKASSVVDSTLRTALAGAIGWVFVIAFLVAGLGLLATLTAPRGRIADLAAERSAGEQHEALLHLEM